MDRQAVNKFLTEKITENFKCQDWIEWRRSNRRTPCLDFFTWEGFGRALEWAINQEWGDRFINGVYSYEIQKAQLKINSETEWVYVFPFSSFIRNVFKPDILAQELANFLGYTE